MTALNGLLNTRLSYITARIGKINTRVAETDGPYDKRYLWIKNRLNRYTGSAVALASAQNASAVIGNIQDNNQGLLDEYNTI